MNKTHYTIITFKQHSFGFITYYVGVQWNCLLVPEIVEVSVLYYFTVVVQG